MTEVRATLCGRGLFATRAVPARGRVLQEAPLAITDFLEPQTAESQLWPLLFLAWDAHRDFLEQFDESFTDELDGADMQLADSFAAKKGVAREDVLRVYRKLSTVHYRADPVLRRITVQTGTETLNIVVPDSARRALYRELSFVNHSCNPNCAILEGRGSERVLVAVRDIAEREELTFSYARLPPESTREQLWEHVRATFGFCCRCSDECRDRAQRAQPPPALTPHA